jgi:hypothetical protein
MGKAMQRRNAGQKAEAGGGKSPRLNQLIFYTPPPISKLNMSIDYKTKQC